MPKLTWWERFKRSTAGTQANIICTIIIAAATVTYTVFAKLQWKTMDGQLQQMKGSSDQTERLLCLYQQQLAQLTKQAIDTHTLATAAGDQAAAASTSAKTAQLLLQANIGNFHREQRAWVVPYEDAMRRNKSGEVYFDVIFKNTGRTPGIHVRGSLAGASSLDQIPKQDPDPGGNGTIVAPDSPYHLTTSTHPISDAVLAAKWKSGVFLYGTLWYQDVFSRIHWIQFCDETHGDFTEFQPCPIHGDSDDSVRIRTQR
jgi:hypothetical protein